MTERDTDEARGTEGRPVEEVLGGEVIADAERRAQRILRQAERDAQRIHQQAEKEAEKVAEDILTEARRRADHASRMVLATVDVETHKAELAAKEELISSCIEAAWRKLLAKDDYDYARLLVELAAEAIVQMPGKEFVVEFAEADRQWSEAALGRDIEQAVAAEGRREVRVRLEPKHPQMTGGCIVHSADGRLRYDNSFEARLQRHRQHLRQLAAHGLFGKQEGEK